MAKASSWQPTMDKCKANGWSTTNEVTTMVVGKFTYAKVKHNTKQKALFLFLVMWTVRLINHCLPVYHFQPSEQLQLLQYFKLQMAKTVVIASFVWVYNIYIPHDSQLCMGKYHFECTKVTITCRSKTVVQKIYGLVHISDFKSIKCGKVLSNPNLVISLVNQTLTCGLITMRRFRFMDNNCSLIKYQ